MNRWSPLALLLSAVLLVGCSGGGDLEPAPEPAPEPTSSTETAPEPEVEVAEAEPVLLGDQPYVQPCQVLPMKQVTTIFKRLGENGYVRQEVLDSSISEAEFKDETDTLTRSLRATCQYNFDDARDNSLGIEVSTYRQPGAGEARWKAIRYLGTGKESAKLAQQDFAEGFEWLADLARENEEGLGGDPVAGAEDQLLYVAGQQNFVTFGDGVLVTLRYGPLDFTDVPLTPAEYAYQVPRMRQAVEAVQRNLSRTDLPFTPAPSVIGPEQEYAAGVPYLEPCSLLTPETFDAVYARPPDPGTERTSLYFDTAAKRERNTEPFSKSSTSDCTRRYFEPGKVGESTSGDLTLEISYAPSPEKAEAVLENHLGWTFFDTEQQRKKYTIGSFLSARLLTEILLTEADALYIFDNTVNLPRGDRQDPTRYAFFTVGPYHFQLSGLESKRKGFDYYSPNSQQFQRAVDLIVPAVRAQMESTT